MVDQNLSKEQLIKEVENLQKELQENSLEIKRLKQDSDSFKLFFDNAPIGKSMTLPDGKLERINQAFAEILGYTVEEMKTLNFAEITHPDDLAESKECVRSLLAGEKDFWKMRKRYFHKNGEIVWTRVSTRLQRDKNNKALYFITHVIDITEQKIYVDGLNKKLNDQLLFEKSMFDSLLENIPDAIYFKNKESKFLKVSQSMKNRFKSSDIIGLTDFDIHDKEHAQQAFLDEKEIIKTGKPKIGYIEKEMLKGGKKRYVLTTKMPYFDEQGNVIGTFGISSDITQQKQLELEIEEQNQKLKTITSEAQVILFAFDQNGIFTFSEGKGLEKLGLTAGEVVGKSVFEVYKDFPQVVKESERALKGELVKSVVDLGFIKFNTSYTPQYDDTGKVVEVIGVSYDITDLINIQHELKLSEKKFKDAFDYAKIGRAMADPTGKFINVNTSMCDMMGYSEEELLSKSWMDITHSDNLKLSYGMVEKLLKKEITAADYECKFLHKNGNIVWTRINIVLFFNNNGEPLFFNGDVENITKQKKAFFELEDSEKKFRDFVQHVPIPLCNVDEKGVIKFLNERFIKTFGYTQEDIPTLDKWWQLAYPDEKYREWVVQNWTEAVDRALKTGGDITPDAYKVTCKNGEERLIIIGGITIGKDFLATFSDITEQHKAEALLKEREYLYQITTEAANAGVYDWKVDTNEVFYSDVWKKQVGYEPDQLKNDFSTWSELLHPEDSERSHKAVQDYLENPRGHFNLEFRFKHKDGSYRWIRNVAESFKDEKGNVKRLFGIHTDITAQKEAELQLINEKNISESIISSTPGVFYQINTDGKFVRWNKNFETVTGYSTEKMSKISPLDLFEGENKKRIGEAIGNVFTSGYEEVEADLTLKDGSKIPYIFTGTLNIIDNEPFLLGVGLDISNIRKAQKIINKSEEKLKKYTVELKRSNKELQEFAYVASHDLQEPLRKIKNFTELLEMKYKDSLDEKAQKYMDIITSGTNRMQILINDLLTISRISTKGGEFTQTDLNEILSEVKEILELKINENQAKIVYDKLPVINADGKQLLQLFQNLISNAIKFKSEKLPVINISVSENSDDWEFVVEDNGIGFDIQFAERIFVVFQRLHTRNEYEGTGIGLAICKKIIDRHNGKIHAESNLNEGAKFIFSIPKNLKNNQID